MQRDVGILKHRADRDAELFAASVALPDAVANANQAAPAIASRSRSRHNERTPGHRASAAIPVVHGQFVL